MESLIVYQSPCSEFRIGKPNDGGYVVTRLPGSYDLFISGGISNDISFEQKILDLYPNLFCYAFDGTINKLPSQHPRFKWTKKNLAADNTDTTTNLIDYMANYNDIFMKIDIEGHEYRVMPGLFEKNYMSKVKQLVIEIHSPADIHLYPDYFKGLSDITNLDMFDLLHKMTLTHTLVHFHANNGCKMQEVDGIKLPHVFELTYLRNDFVTEKIPNTQTLPTPLDMKNVTWMEDYSINWWPFCHR
jgi:hypothetical protein